MNKRILCLLLSFLMLTSAFMTGCSKKDDDEKYTDIAKDAAKNTVTLSMYLMSEEPVSEAQEKRIETVVNQITKSKFKIELDLRYFTEEQYYDALEKAFKDTENEKAAKKAAEQALKEAIKRGEATTPPPTDNTEATEEATIINDLGIPELAYPSISDHQIDIFYLGGYDKYSEYMLLNRLAQLDDDLASDAEIITDNVSSNYLTYINKLSLGTFMIPSNKSVGEYTYLLLNKDVLKKYNYSSTKGFSSLTSENVGDVLSNVSKYNPEYLPLYASEDDLDLLNISYYGVDANGNITRDFSVMGGSCDPSWKYLGVNNFYDFHNLFTSAEFKKQMRVLTEYRLNGYYGTEADADKPFAVGYVKGPAELVEEYQDEYEIVVVEKPKMSTEDIYAHGFAVSSTTTKVSRSMEIVTYLNTNRDFRNLILYGIEGENYNLVKAIDEETGEAYVDVNGDPYMLVERINDDYVMDVNKTGNVILAYPMVGELYNIREYQKAQNRDLSVMLDLGFVLDKDDPDDKIDDEEKELDDDHNYINVYAMGKVAELSAQLKEEMLSVESLEELEEFFSYAKTTVDNDKYFKAMSNINYSRYSTTYNSSELGVGNGFAYLYKAWLDMHGLWKE